MYDVLLFLLQSGFSAALTLLTFIGLAPTKLGERFVNFYLERKLAALRHDHNQEIAQLNARLAHLGDRGTRSNEREFDAISALWEKYVDAYVATLRCAIAYTSHPDLAKLEEEEVTRFLNSTDLSDAQKAEVMKALDKNKAFRDFVNLNYISEAGVAIFNARSTLRKQAIFIPDDIQSVFSESLDPLAKAQIQRSMEPFYGAHSKLGGVDFLLTNSDKIFHDLLTPVRRRMLYELTDSTSVALRR